jgi:hypothetical protein
VNQKEKIFEFRLTQIGRSSHQYTGGSNYKGKAGPNINREITHGQQRKVAEA